MAKANNRAYRSRASNVALGIAAATIPRSFQPSLLPRSAADQGIATGMIFAMVYGIGLLIQDSLDSVVNNFSATQAEHNNLSDEDYNRVYQASSALSSLGAVGLGLLAVKLLEQQPGESNIRSGARVLGIWTAFTGITGLVVQLYEFAFNEDNDPTNGTETTKMVPAIVATATLITTIGEYLRRRKIQENSPSNLKKKDALVSLGIGAATAVVLTGIAVGEQKAAKKITKIVDERAPILNKSKLPLGHLIAAGALGGVAYLLLKKTYKDIEQGSSVLEAGVEYSPLSSYISGSRESYVSWATLTKESRRHLATWDQTKDIPAVMETDTYLQPIRAYVGLDSAPTQKERVALAIAELKRTGAFEREVIAVVSPTGTGYINYIYTESLEYLTKGNVASIALQYSKRPSPMSLDKVSNGHVQYRMLLNAIKKELIDIPPAKRPRIVLFGESLGAWTSQDAFLHEGTDGFDAVGVDSALWLGTPAGSKWAAEVLGPKADRALNLDSELIGKFATYEELQEVPLAERKKLRYFLLTNHNDPIAYFGINLLLRRPEWLTKSRDERPGNIPKATNWRTPATFVHTMIDMKNALNPTPGEFISNGHDYRATIARFVNEAYRLGATKKQLKNVEAALRRNEIDRSNFIGHLKQPSDV